MSQREMLVKLAEMSWRSLLESLDGLTEEVAWATVDLQPDEYLHTEGSILSQIAHIANGKIIYASVGFRENRVRWRELSPKVDSLWPRLDAVVEWLHEAHAYWLASWEEVEDLETMRPRFDGKLYPGWELIAIGIQHDSYHAGQIALQRSILAPTSQPPPLEGELWKGYCEHFPSW